ncbi:MAG: triple tyrosine motif-containing protein [Ferruginibacter sp.]
MKPGLLLLIIISFCFYFSASSQDITHYQFTHLSQNNGLSATYVRKIVQDPYGFTWIATQDGLNRFDGKKVNIYNEDNKINHRLVGSDVRDLLIDTNHFTIWIITSYGGINGIDYRTGNVWYEYDQQKNLKEANVLFNSFALADSNIYIGSSQGLYRIDHINFKLEKIDLRGSKANMSNVFIDELIVDKNKNGWIFTQTNGVIFTNRDFSKILSLSNDTLINHSIRYYDAVLKEDNVILLATSQGLKTLRLNAGGKILVDHQPFSFAKSLTSQEIFSCWLEKNGNIIFSDAKTLIRLNPQSKKYSIIAENTTADVENWLGSVYTIYIDRNNILWLGCQQGLAFAENKPSAFYRIYQSLTSNTKIGHAYYLNPINDSTLITCAQDGLYKIDTKKGGIDNIGEKKSFYHAFEDPKGRLIISNREGTFILDQKKLIDWKTIYPEFRKLPNLILNCHIQINDSLLLLGTENFLGIVVWNFRKKTAYLITDSSIELKLGENVINALYKDKKENIWALGDHSITVFDKKLQSFKLFTPYNSKQKKYYSIFFDVCQVNEFYYVASYGNGMLILDSSFQFIKSISGHEKLSSSSIYKLLPYHDSLIFVTSNNGLSVVSVKENQPSRFYFENDGLHSNTFEENSGAVYENILYAGGEKGATIINPEYLSEDKFIPRLFLSELTIDCQNETIDTSNLGLRSMTVPNNANQTLLTFSALNYLNPSKTNYAYRIVELQIDWVNLGSQNIISLIGMHPGIYNIQVKASNGVNKNESEIYTVELRFLPKWYQTILFKTSIVLVILGIIYLFYMYRLAQIKKQLEIRKDIASDLHDDIGSILNSVKIFTHLAKRDPGKNEYLDHIEDSLTQATLGLRDMIWVLDDARDSIYEVMERITNYALPVCQVQNIHFEHFIETDSSVNSLTKTEKRNLLLIAKEATNNSIKYSNCQTIKVTIAQSNSKISLYIQDDGAGFNLETSTKGNGIKNIQQRAKQIYLTANFVTSIDSGTTVIVK